MITILVIIFTDFKIHILDFLGMQILFISKINDFYLQDLSSEGSKGSESSESTDSEDESNRFSLKKKPSVSLLYNDDFIRKRYKLDKNKEFMEAKEKYESKTPQSNLVSLKTQTSEDEKNIMPPPIDSVKLTKGKKKDHKFFDDCSGKN